MKRQKVACRVGEVYPGEFLEEKARPLAGKGADAF